MEPLPADRQPAVRVVPEWQPDRCTLRFLDSVLDDSSHVASHQRVTVETLFPLLAEDGLYVAEDLHTSNRRDDQSGYRPNGTFLKMTKAFVDDMHA
ncbi:hypothetical protein [Methylobacterium sp. R2-1]|uniref:hypothetical protein n=1 Tax=Methylobacterium sp. R2-1 TaxID=2587064 RepID=UPI001851864D|nr:hypothetical protein [Methylobacterium sp. R2-1]MBB2961481.1 hypothetical protein [Methylobacterium sp. R2-1]